MAATSLTPEMTDERPQPPGDMRRTWRIMTAVILPLGPLGVTIARGLMPYWTSDDAGTIVRESMARLGTMEVLTWLGLLFVPLLLLGVLGLGFVARRGAPVLATVGAGLTFFAFAVQGGTASSDYVLLVLARHGWDAASIEQISTVLQDHPSATAAGIVFVVGHIVGMILLGIAVGRACLAPWWVAACLALSQPIHLVAAVIVPSRALDVIAGWGVTTMAFAWVAVTILRMRDDEWDLPPARRAVNPASTRTPRRAPRSRACSVDRRPLLHRPADRRMR